VNELKKICEFARTNLNMSEPINAHHKPLRMHADFNACREWSCRDASDIDGQAERPNGAFGKSDIEGKTAREAASELGKEGVSNERERMSQYFRSRFN
jgi:hypothetical protein